MLAHRELADADADAAEAEAVLLLVRSTTGRGEGDMLPGRGLGLAEGGAAPALGDTAAAAARARRGDGGTATAGSSHALGAGLSDAAMVADAVRSKLPGPVLAMRCTDKRGGAGTAAAPLPCSFHSSGAVALPVVRPVALLPALPISTPARE